MARRYRPGVRQMNELKARLVAAGYTHILTVVSGDKDDREFGLLFTKHNPVTTSKFWLNIYTYDKLPEGV